MGSGASAIPAGADAHDGRCWSITARAGHLPDQPVIAVPTILIACGICPRERSHAKKKSPGRPRRSVAYSDWAARLRPDHSSNELAQAGGLGPLVWEQYCLIR